MEKIENSKLFQNPKKIEFIMLILFLIPGTPKDLLVYVAGLLPIKPLKFILISTFARFPSVITSTLAGEQLAIGDWKMSIVLYGIILIFVAILVFIINKLDKDKYVLFIEKQYVEQMEKNTFEILERVKNITDKTKLPITISIGMSYSENTLNERYMASSSALDIALERGL